MVTRSIDDYQQHKLDLYKKIKKKVGERKAKTFIDFYASRYDKYERSFIAPKLAWSLYNDYRQVDKSGVRWIAIIGTGGVGKTTTGKNVAYFLDETFDSNRVKMTTAEIVEEMVNLPTVDAMKSLLMDEPDSIHPQSKQGSHFKSILGKARQQKVFMIYCATDPTQIPSYIFNKITTLIYIPEHGKGYVFKDNPKKDKFALSMIKKDYGKLGWSAFHAHKKLALRIKLTKEIPLSEEQEAEYQKLKAQDYHKDMKNFLTLYGSGKQDKDSAAAERIRIIKTMLEKGSKQNEIAKMIGLSTARISQIVKEYSL